MDPFYWLFIFFAFLGINCVSLAKSIHESPLVKCKKEIGKKELTSLSGMVGMGWDNLQNLPMAQVWDINFSNCLTTTDGEFLIPDNMQTIPIKKINIDKMASLHESYSEYLNSNAESINIHGGGSYAGIGASASFSAGHQFAKKQFSTDSNSMFVTTIDYLAYKILVQSATDLHPDFKKRLLSINHAISKNLTSRVRYLSELVIRDFGTHLITSADVGARIQQEDFVHLDKSETSSSTIWSMKAAASASFLSVVNVGASASAQVKDEEKTSFTNKLTHSRIVTKGGPNVNHLLKTTGPNDKPSLEIDDLVVTDRSGVPLYTLIDENTMPELRYSSAERLNQAIKEAMDKYYQTNEIEGCMNPSSPNFDYRANIEASCDTQAYNQTFGGIYQTCEEKHEWGGSTMVHESEGCSALEQKNILTNDYSCESNYEPVLVLRTHYPLEGLDRDGNHVVDKNLQLHMKTFYCRAKSNIPREKGFMFGGFYAKDRNNTFTGSASCPKYYVAQKIFKDSVICLSQDFALAAAEEVKIGGFFSCTSKGTESGCPEGFTQEVATVENGCVVLYCVEPLAFIKQMPALIKRPPFENPSSLKNEMMNMAYLYYKNQTSSHKHELNNHNLKNGTSNESNTTLSLDQMISEEELDAFIQKEYLTNEYLPKESEKLELSNQEVLFANGWLIGITIGVILILLASLASLIIIFKKVDSKKAKYDIGNE